MLFPTCYVIPLSIGRIRKKSHYQYVARNGVKFVPSSREFVMQGALPLPVSHMCLSSKHTPNCNEEDSSVSVHCVRFGFIVTRKNGSAVMRNRIRRRLKEACRMAICAPGNAIQQAVDVVVVGHRSAADIPFSTLVKDVIESLGRIRLKLNAK